MKIKSLQLIFLFSFFLLVSCGHVQSGYYVRLTGSETTDTLAEHFNISSDTLKRANPTKKFIKDEWIFIPREDGIVSYFDKNRKQMLLEDLQKSEREEQNRIFSNKRFLWPVPASRHVTSEYGFRGERPHEGMDIAAPIGSSILSVDDGVVVYSGNDLSGYGNITVISHKEGYFSIYAHAMKNYTKKGQRIYKGQVIALVGMTGHTTGPHLHLEIRRNSQAYNPESFFGEKMILAQ